MMNFKKDLYPFTTESINGYIHDMDLKDKSVLTLGSSLDQAYNSLLLGASKVTVFDINVNAEKFHKLKSNLILTHPRKQLYDKVMSSYNFHDYSYTTEGSVYKCNLYMQSEDNYGLLREKLSQNEISFINGNIFDIKDSLDDNLYDRMILSNAVQYLEMYSINKDVYKVLKKMFNTLKSHLNDEGIMQLLYFYNTKLINGNICYDDFFNGYNLDKILEVLSNDDLDNFKLLEFENDYIGKDAVVLYKKR